MLQGLDQRLKMEEVVPKMACWEAQMWHNPEGFELDPAEDVLMHCKKEYSFGRRLWLLQQSQKSAQQARWGRASS